MKSKKTLLVLFLLVHTLCSTAQKKRLSGYIRDSHSDEPVPFASVYFKGTTQGNLTDSAGAFSFSFYEWPADTLLISCVGYQPFRFYINKAKDFILTVIKLERGTFNEGVKVKIKVNKG